MRILEYSKFCYFIIDVTWLPRYIHLNVPRATHNCYNR